MSNRTSMIDLTAQVNAQIERMNEGQAIDSDTFLFWDNNDDCFDRSFRLFRKGYHVVFLIVGVSPRDALEKALVALQAAERYHDALMSSKR